MPLTPHMSPAAIGCSVVRLRGWPSASNLAPMAASTASGQPSPDDEETVTTAPSGIRWAASEAVKTFVPAISASNRQIDGSFASRSRSLARREREAEGLDSVLARSRGRPTARNRIAEQAHRPLIKILVRDRELPLAVSGPQQDLAFGHLGHGIGPDQRSLFAMDLKAGHRVSGCEGVVELSNQPAFEADHPHDAVFEACLAHTTPRSHRGHGDRI